MEKLRALEVRHVNSKSPWRVRDRDKAVAGRNGRKKYFQGLLNWPPGKSMIFTKSKQKNWVSGQTFNVAILGFVVSLQTEVSWQSVTQFIHNVDLAFFCHRIRKKFLDNVLVRILCKGVCVDLRYFYTNVNSKTIFLLLELSQGYQNFFSKNLWFMISICVNWDAIKSVIPLEKYGFETKTKFPNHN